MKKISAFLLALLGVLTLSACGKKPAEQEMNPSLPPEPPVQETQQTESVPSAPAELPQTGTQTHGAQMELTAVVEGQEEKRPATRFDGEGYSLYILDEGWWFESELDDGVPVESWEKQGLEDTELSVLRLAGTSVEEAKSIIQLDEDDYRLTEDAQGNLSGEDTMDRTTLNVRFYAGEGMTYVLRMECPTEALEGLGVWMNAMADTFQLSK